MEEVENAFGLEKSKNNKLNAEIRLKMEEINDL